MRRMTFQETNWGLNHQPLYLLAGGAHFGSKCSCSSPFAISQFSNTFSTKITFLNLYRSVPQIMELIFSLYYVEGNEKVLQSFDYKIF